MHNEYQGEPGETHPPILEPINFADLAALRPERGPAYIDGILREGAVGTLISSSKARKSWAVAALIAAGLTGGQWFGRAVAKGRVLLIDGELTRATIFWRLSRVFESLGVSADAFASLDVFDLRGRTAKAPEAMQWAASKGPGFYRHIIVDPLSCFYPKPKDETPGFNFNENDNAHMRRIMDDAINFATTTRTAVMIVHHLSKGAQFEKAVVDLGSGAGALARSVDAHLAFRPHKEKECVVLEGAIRDFPELVPTVWRWSFPVYSAALELDPADLYGRKSKNGPSSAEFLAGGKAGGEVWTPETFVERLLTDQGQIIEQVLMAGKAYDQKERALRGLLKVALEQKMAFKWWEKGSNEPARYSRKPPPSPPTNVPPTPPMRERMRGRGDCAKGERHKGEKSKKSKPTDAGMRTPAAEKKLHDT